VLVTAANHAFLIAAIVLALWAWWLSRRPPTAIAGLVALVGVVAVWAGGMLSVAYFTQIGFGRVTAGDDASEKARLLAKAISHAQLAIAIEGSALGALGLVLVLLTWRSVMNRSRPNPGRDEPVQPPTEPTRP
jgi:hypothetical protein